MRCGGLSLLGLPAITARHPAHTHSDHGARASACDVKLGPIALPVAWPDVHAPPHV